jgi:hypothetical protein
MSRLLFWLLFAVAALVMLPLRNKWHRWLTATITRSGGLGLAAFAAVLAVIVRAAGRPQDRWLLGLAGFYLVLAIIVRRRA